MVTETAPSRPDWDEFRRQMPVAPEWAYFDHAAVGPLSLPARQAVEAWAAEAAEQGDTCYAQWMKSIEQARNSAAQLLGADLEEVALIPNTTVGISLVAEGFPWQAGDNVVTLENEFPSNQYPWMNLQARGVEVRRVAVEEGHVALDVIDAACDEKTRLVAASWIGFASGWRTDLDALAEVVHRNGALLVLDAIQGLGVMPLDLRQTPVDFLSAGGHKWLLSPEGSGIFFLRREHLDLLRPVGVGWNSVVHYYRFDRIDLDLRPTAARYEGGTYNTPGLLGLGASLKLLEAYGTEAISRRILHLSDYACERLAEIGATLVSKRQPTETGHDPRSGIVSFDLPGENLRRLRMRLMQNKVVVSFRCGALRIALHAYNNEDDVDRLVDGIRSER